MPQTTIKFVLFLVFIGLFLTSNISAQTIDTNLNKIESQPILRGDEAINQLKQTGQYDSLMDAVNAARKEDGQTDEPSTKVAIGQSAELTASDGAANDQFGYSVATSGNTAIVGAVADTVGAIFGQGSAYIFRVLVSNWTQEAQKVASDGASSDQFGSTVAISGDTAIVGVRSDDIGANTNQGSAYIFVRNGTVWAEQQKLTASDGGLNDEFGVSVAISGDTVIIGTRFDDVGANVDQGSAYIFVRSGTVWTQQQKLTASDGGLVDNFGTGVAISGESVIVGSNGNDVGANNNQGSAYIFARSGTVWTEQQKLTASDGLSNDQFGRSVSINGETAIVGVQLDDFGVNSAQGSAYIFIRNGTVWTEQQKLTAPDGAANDRFGISVAISGETAIVGANLDDIGANSDQGSAYIFVRSGTFWTQQQKLTASDGAGFDNFGNSVSINGDTAIVGAFGDDVGVNGSQGSAYVFVRNGAVWTQQQKLTAIGGNAGDDFGTGVAISGDKIIVGAPLSDDSASAPLAPQATDQGAMFIFVNQLVPTAANVSVTGRVLTTEGRGLRNAVVHLVDSNGVIRTSRTSTFGYYRFFEIEAGQTVIISVTSKRYEFMSQTISLSETLTDVDFTPHIK